MHLELTPTELKIVREALSKYRTIKNAEGRLTSQKQKTREDIETAWQPYARLLNAVETLQKKVESDAATATN